MIYNNIIDAIDCAEQLIEQYSKETRIDVDKHQLIKTCDVINSTITLSTQIDDENKPILRIHAKRKGIFSEHSLYPVYYCTQWEVNKLWGDTNEI